MNKYQIIYTKNENIEKISKMLEKIYHKKNKDKISEKMKLYFEKDKDKISEKMK